MTATLLDALMYAQAGLLFAALPLSAIAVYGFRGTPWGRVLAPLPVVQAAFVTGLGVGLLDATGQPWVYVQASAFGVGVVGTTLVAFRLARLVSGGMQA